MKQEHIITVVGVIFLIGIVGYLIFLQMQSAPVKAKSEALASCLADSGSIFYGAFWCPHCAEQKALFNKVENLPYFECSTPDAKDQVQACKDLAIQSYPTWKLNTNDGVKWCRGVVDPELLAFATSCPGIKESSYSSGAEVFNKLILDKAKNNDRLSGRAFTAEREKELTDSFNEGLNSKAEGTTIENSTVEQAFGVVIDQSCLSDDVNQTYLELLEKQRAQQQVNSSN